MILIAAALAEELAVVLDLCQNRSRLDFSRVHAWTGTRAGRTVTILKTGVGPKRAEMSLNRLLEHRQLTGILVIGYGGALDPGLKVGELVVCPKTFLFADEPPAPSSLEDVALAGAWPLAESERIHKKAVSAGLGLRQGSALTCHHILGDPAHKAHLYRRFQAAIVDMETAALARAAAPFGVPLACVRAVSDAATDDFLAPFSYGPSATMATRAVQVLGSGRWINRYSQWRERATIARTSLREFVAWYLESYLPG